jgi:N-acetylmuramoyl-L-alanine amidase
MRIILAKRLVIGWAAAALLLGFLGQEAWGRSLAVEVWTPEGVHHRGRLPVIDMDEGPAYISLNRLAALIKIKPTWSPKSTKAVFKVDGKIVRLTQDRPSVSVQGRTVRLSAPPRLLSGEWIVPEEFLDAVLPRLFPTVRVAAVAAPVPKPAAKPARASVAVTDLRFRSYPTFTRVVLEASGPFGYQVEPGSKEVRVRLSGFSPLTAMAQEVGDGLVRELRVEGFGGEAALKVPLEGALGEMKRDVLEDPFRLVLDFYRAKEPRTEAEPKAQPLRVMVLDAGHGGHDPGAIGPSGLQEKEVVLDVTKRLARLVEEGLGVTVRLTRTGDNFVPLKERTSFANAQRADLFVSIHANAHRASVSEGVETYFLSSEATDNEARQVAALENGVIQLEPGNSKAKMDVLKSILWDLAQSEFQQESSQLAETVQDSMVQSLRIPTRGVKQAGFYVLGGAAMPAVLVEIGFLTNRKEERKLMDPNYRERVARAIYAGLAEYKRRYDQKMAPPRTVEVSR